MRCVISSRAMPDFFRCEPRRKISMFTNLQRESLEALRCELDGKADAAHFDGLLDGKANREDVNAALSQV